MSVDYKKSKKYTDLKTIYEQVSGPGGLELADFMAQKMGVFEDSRLLDVGCNRGFQSCFLAKEYKAQVVAMDPWDDRMTQRPMVEHVRENAHKWEVENRVLAIANQVPDSGFADRSFDFVYTTTALEMLRCIQGEEGYFKALQEIKRILRPKGIMGLGEPMRLEVDLPLDLEPYVSQKEYPWKECFRGIEQTKEAVLKAGFEILEAGYAPKARQWWLEYAEHDPFCRMNPDEDPLTLEKDQGRWVSFGYVIAQKKD